MSKHKKNGKYHKNNNEKYLKRKLLFWAVVSILLLSFSLVIGKQIFGINQEQKELIRVGICGQVKHPAVYSMYAGSDLSSLILKASGLTLSANVSNVNFDNILKNDSIYHIPLLAHKREFLKEEKIELEQSNPTETSISRSIAEEMRVPELKKISTLYVGFPAVFIIIDYYPELERISLTHLPHTCLFMESDYRLIDLFFTLGVEPIVNLLENRLNQKIDYYIVQDRNSFIDMIDVLGGLEINIDQPFATQYKIEPGKTRLTGFMTWEFVRFMDMRSIKRDIVSDRKINLITEDNFTAKSGEWQLAYELRNQRQKQIMSGMRQAFSRAGVDKQAHLLSMIAQDLNTNIKLNLLLDIYTNLLNAPDYTYGTLPGYYEENNNNVYFIPDIPSFGLMKRKEIRSYLQVRSKKKQTIY